MAQNNKRVVRQTLFLTSNYFHNLMLVHASECTDVPVNVRGTLEAAHDAINAFFMLFQLLESEARVWWVFNHRAFLEAVCIGNVLREAVKEEGGKEMLARDPLFVRARSDIGKLLQGSDIGCIGWVETNDTMWFSANGSDHAAHGRRIRGCSPTCGSAEWIPRVRKLRARWTVVAMPKRGRSFLVSSSYY